VFDRSIQADDQRPERVIDRLRSDLASLDRLRLLRDPSSDVLDAQAPERDRLQLRQQPLAAVDLIAPPRARLQVRLATCKPAMPEMAERLARVSHLAALDPFDEAPLGVASGSLAGEAALGRLTAFAVAGLEVPTGAAPRRVGVDAARAL